MIQYHVYPGAKKRVATFSYDDGRINDEKLVNLFNKYGVKSTFCLNGGNYLKISESEAEKLRRVYEGHEIACHTLQHGWPSRMPYQSIVNEVMEDRKTLETIFKTPIVGMSYPSGSYNVDVIKAIESCGIVYSRTTKSTQDFFLPENFMEWHPTCHHNDAISRCRYFIENIDSQWRHPMLYVWGHSHELQTEADWEHMEKILKLVSNNDKIWYATNIEIYNYIVAQNQLQISVDETIFYNPSDITVWVERDKKDVIKIPAGQKIHVG